MESHEHPLMQGIAKHHASMTPKGRIIAEYTVKNPRQVVFMTINELSDACRVSEATVFRFVTQLGYKGYGEFIQMLRDFVNIELTILDRVDLSDMTMADMDHFHRIVIEEIDNLKQLSKAIHPDDIEQVVDYLHTSPTIYIIGSRLSYAFAYYMGWSLGKIRPDIHVLKGSDSTTIDRLTIASTPSLIVIITTSRYPNELIRIGKISRHRGHTLLLITDSAICPLVQFAHLSLVAPSRHVPVIGDPTSLICLINHIIFKLAGRSGKSFKRHQEKLEQAYYEHDILFNLDKKPGDSQPATNDIRKQLLEKSK